MFKREISEESKEKKARELNLVLHGIKENTEEGASGRDKWNWDVQTCNNLYQALKLNLNADNIKFCRRVGERGSDPRPLILGLFNFRDRALLLNQDLRGTEYFSDITIGPDLTKQQRKEEAETRKEMEARNAKLSEDDKAKNLVWRMVGPRGERRLIKGLNRDREGTSRTGEGATGGVPLLNSRGRGAGGWKPRGGPSTGRGGMNLRNRATISDNDTINLTEEEGRVGRDRLNSKRTREQDVMEEEEPPAKH